MPLQHADESGHRPIAPGDESPADSTLTGEFERMLDEKGRVTIPPRLRERLGAEFMAARGAAGSVLVIPADLWPEVEERLRENAENGDRYLQFAIHNHTRTALDRQGRLKLPRHLLEWAGINPGDAVAILANGRKFEVRNIRSWNEMRKTAPSASQPRPGSGLSTPRDKSNGL